jgi:hypothetical protein
MAVAFSEQSSGLSYQNTRPSGNAGKGDGNTSQDEDISEL